MSAKRRSEDRLPDFDRLFEHSHQGVLILSADGRRILDANPKGAEMLGRPPPELVGRDLSDFVSKDLADLTEFTKTVTNHGVAWSDQLSWPGKAGIPTPVELSASGFESDRGQFVLLVIHDTALARRNEKKRAVSASRKQAAHYRAQLDRFQAEVLNTTAHEFRTPLTPIFIQISMLEKHLKDFLTDEDRESFGVIRRNVTRIERSVETILRAAERRKAAET